MSAWSRESFSKTCVIAKDAMTSGVAQISSEIFGSVLLPSGTEGSTLTFLASSTRDGTFNTVYDEDGSAVAATLTAGSWVTIPLDAMKHQSIKFVAASSQAAARTLTVLTKN